MYSLPNNVSFKVLACVVIACVVIACVATASTFDSSDFRIFLEPIIFNTIKNNSIEPRILPRTPIAIIPCKFNPSFVCGITIRVVEGVYVFVCVSDTVCVCVCVTVSLNKGEYVKYIVVLEEYDELEVIDGLNDKLDDIVLESVGLNVRLDDNVEVFVFVNEGDTLIEFVGVGKRENDSLLGITNTKKNKEEIRI